MSYKNKGKPTAFLVVMLSIFAFSLSDKVCAADTAPPSVILSSYSISKNSFTGEVITLHLVFTNTSPNLDVNDILISYTSANDIFLPVYGVSNQFFIPVIRAGTSVDYDLNISVNNIVPNQDQYEGLYFNFNVTFSDMINGVNTNSFFISDIVKSEDAIQLLGIDATDINILGKDEIIISFKATVLNHSYLLVQNASMVLEGKNPDFTISIPLNDISPGQHLTSDFHLTFPSLNVPVFNVKFSYKDIKGASYYSDVQKVTVYLNNLSSGNNREQSVFRVVGLVFSFILLALWAVVFFIRLRKKKSL